MDPILDLQVLQYLPRLKWLRVVLCGSIFPQTCNLAVPNTLEHLDASCPNNRSQGSEPAHFSELDKVRQLGCTAYMAQRKISLRTCMSLCLL